MNEYEKANKVFNEVQDKFLKQQAIASAEYDKIEEAARIKYEKVIDAAEAKYEKAISPIWDEYTKAWDEYEKAKNEHDLALKKDWWYNKDMENMITFVSQRGNLLSTADVVKAAERFITPAVKPGESYVNTVLFAPTKVKRNHKKVKPQTFYIKATKGGK